MTTGDAFTGVRFAGPIFGADLKHHDLFKVERTQGPPVYGEYVLIPVLGSEIEFNTGIDLFGYIDRFNLGNLHPGARKRFTAEECAAVEKVIRPFFSDPDIFKQKFLPPVKSLGGVSFRPDWIIRRPHLEVLWEAANSDDPIYLEDFLGDDVEKGVATNLKNEVVRVEDVARLIRGLAVDTQIVARIDAILKGFSVDADWKNGGVAYRGTVGALSAREAALRDANRNHRAILDKTEFGKLCVNEEVMDAIRDLLVKFFQLHGLGCVAAVQAAHKKIGPEPEPKIPNG
jgi:hypothetical protein